MDYDGSVWMVSYKRDEGDEFTSTNIVHARSTANIDREFGKYAWVSMRWARDWEIEEARAKGMPERWV